MQHACCLLWPIIMIMIMIMIMIIIILIPPDSHAGVQGIKSEDIIEIITMLLLSPQHNCPSF